MAELTTTSLSSIPPFEKSPGIAAEAEVYNQRDSDFAVLFSNYLSEHGLRPQATVQNGKHNPLAPPPENILANRHRSGGPVFQAPGLLTDKATADAEAARFADLLSKLPTGVAEEINTAFAPLDLPPAVKLSILTQALTDNPRTSSRHFRPVYPKPPPEHDAESVGPAVSPQPAVTVSPIATDEGVTQILPAVNWPSRQHGFDTIEQVPVKVREPILGPVAAVQAHQFPRPIPNSLQGIDSGIDEVGLNRNPADSGALLPSTVNGSDPRVPPAAAQNDVSKRSIALPSRVPTGLDPGMLGTNTEWPSERADAVNRLAPVGTPDGTLSSQTYQPIQIGNSPAPLTLHSQTATSNSRDTGPVPDAGGSHKPASPPRGARPRPACGRSRITAGPCDLGTDLAARHSG